jgi:hypothetical protein
MLIINFSTSEFRLFSSPHSSVGVPFFTAKIIRIIIVMFAHFFSQLIGGQQQCRCQFFLLRHYNNNQLGKNQTW